MGAGGGQDEAAFLRAAVSHAWLMGADGGQAFCRLCAGVASAPAVDVRRRTRPNIVQSIPPLTSGVANSCAGIKPTFYGLLSRFPQSFWSVFFLDFLSISGSCQHFDSSSRKVCLSTWFDGSIGRVRDVGTVCPTQLLLAGAHRGSYPCVKYYLLRQTILHFEG